MFLKLRKTLIDQIYQQKQSNNQGRTYYNSLDYLVLIIPSNESMKFFDEYVKILAHRQNITILTVCFMNR